MEGGHRAFRSRLIGILPLIALGAIIEAACLEIVRIGDLRVSLATVWVGDHPVTILVFWLPFLAAFLTYLVVVGGPRPTTSPPGETAKGEKGERETVAVLLVFAVLFRVTLLFSPPTLSDDLYRYVWDGRTQNHGINPYRYPPNAPELTGLRDAYYPGINNKPIPTVYPPLMEIVFRVVDRIAHTPMAMKVVFVLCDLGVIVLLGLLLRTRHLPIVRVVIYAWNPLVLVEVAGSGHNDVLAVGLMLAALLALAAGRPILSVVSLALSVASKLFAVVLLPSVARAMPRKRALLLFPVVVGLLSLPYLDAGRHLTTGLFVYGNKWRFNDSLFTLALSATGDLTLAKVIVGVLFLGVALTRLRGSESPVRTAYVLIGAYLILTPTVQSWYLLWLLPFLCFFPNRAWLLLSGLIMLSYHVLIQFTRTGLWREALWVRYVEYIPFYVLLIVDYIKGRKG